MTTQSSTAALQSLQKGACVVKENVAQAVIVQNANNDGGSECCSDPTNAVVIDSAKVGNIDCATVRWNIKNTNGDAVATILRLGGGIAGMNGGYQVYGVAADASNSSIVLADGQPNVLPVQLFNNFTRNGFIMTRVLIEVNSGTAPTKATKNKFTIDGEDCQSRVLKGFCNACFPGTNQPQVVEYKKCIALDDFNFIDFPIPVGADFDVEVDYIGVGTAKAYVGCDGALLNGNIVAQAL